MFGAFRKLGSENVDLNSIIKNAGQRARFKLNKLYCCYGKILCQENDYDSLTID